MRIGGHPSGLGNKRGRRFYNSLAAPFPVEESMKMHLPNQAMFMRIARDGGWAEKPAGSSPRPTAEPPHSVARVGDPGAVQSCSSCLVFRLFGSGIGKGDRLDRINRIAQDLQDSSRGILGAVQSCEF